MGFPFNEKALGAGGSQASGVSVLGSTFTAVSGTGPWEPKVEEKHALPTVWGSLVYSSETGFFPGLSFLVFDISSNKKTKDIGETLLEHAKLTCYLLLN